MVKYQRPYDGPFEVLSRSDNFFVINKNGQDYTVSIDCLKPAFSIPSENSLLPPLALPSSELSAEDFPPLSPSITTRTGRVSRPPDRLNM